MQMHTSNQNNDVTLSQEFQQHLTKDHRKNGAIGQVNYQKKLWKENG